MWQFCVTIPEGLVTGDTFTFEAPLSSEGDERSSTELRLFHNFEPGLSAQLAGTVQALPATPPPFKMCHAPEFNGVETNDALHDFFNLVVRASFHLPDIESPRRSNARLSDCDLRMAPVALHPLVFPMGRVPFLCEA